MTEKKDKIQPKSKNKTGKIVAIIIAAIIVVFAGIYLFLNLNKPTAKDALTSASSTKINSARAEIIVKQVKGQKQSATMRYAFNKKLTHITTTFSPDSSGNNQNMWADSNKIYTVEKGKWRYLTRTGFASTVYTQLLDGYKELFTAHNFKKFSNSAFNQLKVNTNGFDGYSITYKGNNKAVLEGLQNASTISGSTDKTDVTQIKNVDLVIKVNRKKELQEMKYTVTYKNQAGIVSVHLYNVNNTNNLSLPADAKKATRVKVPNIED